jgi:hypothetical protein
LGKVGHQLCSKDGPFHFDRFGTSNEPAESLPCPRRSSFITPLLLLQSLTNVSSLCFAQFGFALGVRDSISCFRRPPCPFPTLYGPFQPFPCPHCFTRRPHVVLCWCRYLRR